MIPELDTRPLILRVKFSREGWSKFGVTIETGPIIWGLLFGILPITILFIIGTIGLMIGPFATAVILSTLFFGFMFIAINDDANKIVNKWLDRYRD